ncbi:NADPH-dependent FMN reductase [Luminiphilus sp. nBUS_07]|uniref:NADPH-dependent FMN reductase n=1 Tax=Luminiphilus sp. nBUS_07 TaxID=3395314 RepID=UPI003EBB71CF
MKIGIVVGSHRHDSQSRKVALYLEQQLQSLNAETWLHDLAHDPLPLWDENLGSGEGLWAFLPDLVEQLQSSDGFVIVSPEWHGMATSAVKNFFLLCNVQSGLAHKPALITAISGGDGGAYVVSELRTSSYKNNRLCYIPEQLVVRNVGKVFNADSAENDPEAHTYFVDRADYSLKLLLAYSEALGALRGGGVVDLDGYPNGM